MRSTRVIVIEDEFFVASHLEDLINSFGFTVVHVYHSGEDFLEQTDWEFDMAVVDIFLSEKMSGLDVANYLIAQQKPFIFLTANQDARTLKDAAALKPMAYITKPFKSNDISAALQIIAHQLPENITIKKSNMKESLNPNDILFIKSDGVYIEIYTTTGKIVQRKLLKEIADELPDYFSRVHRSYLVNEYHIENKTYNSIRIKDYEIPISRKYKKP